MDVFQKLTEGRVPCFNHEVAPAYLRTKPEPEVEEKLTVLTSRGSLIASDALQASTNSAEGDVLVLLCFHLN